MVAPEQEQGEAPFRRHHGDGFNQLGHVRAQELGHIPALGLVRGRFLVQGGAGSDPGRGGGQGLCQFHIGGVVRVRAEGDGVFPRVRQYVEFVGTRTADRAGVRCHCPEFQPQALENPVVSVVHIPVFPLQVGKAGVEGIAVFHQEFPTPHDAEAGTDFVPEFGLDLVEVDGQLAVALDFPPYHVGDYFFVGRADDKVPMVPVLDAQQLRAVFFPAPRFLPKLRRYHGGHEQFLGARPVHFVPDNGFYFAQHPQAQGHPGINAASQALDEAGTDHQFVANDFRFCRSFFEGGEEKLRGAHDEWL